MIFFKKEAKKAAETQLNEQTANAAMLSDSGLRELTACEFVEVSGGADVGAVITSVL
jgi:hypothetical protein